MMMTTMMLSIMAVHQKDNGNNNNDNDNDDNNNNDNTIKTMAITNMSRTTLTIMMNKNTIETKAITTTATTTLETAATTKGLRITTTIA